MGIFDLGKPFNKNLLLVVGCFLFMVFFAPTAWGSTVYFSDNMESGTSKWVLDGSWNIITSAYHGGAKSMTDSPSGYYANNANSALTMAANIDLSDPSGNPQLVFWHKYQVEAGFDFCYVEISADGGASWSATPLASYTGISDWKREQIDLTPYAGQSTVRLRFRLVSDKSNVMDGWYVDDVTVAEPPNAVLITSVGNATASALDISWTQNLDSDFASYKIYRSTTPGVTTSGTLATSITTQTTTAYTDTGLTPGTVYYYKVFVADTRDIFAASKDASGTTITSGYSFPFFDNMEGGVGGWTAQSPWAIDTGTDHTGATGHYWSDSPGGASYANNVSYALSIKINLAGAIRPILHWWQRYAYESQRDYGLVEISTDNSNWTAIYSVTGSSPWEEAVVDLTRWASQTIYLRFRTDSDNNGVNYDGWEVDDVSIKEAPNVSSAWTGNTPYPFTDSFDSEASFTSNWISTNKGKEFVWNNSDGHTASGTAYLYPPQNIPTAAGHYLVLAKPIDLTSSVNPQLSFWHKYRVYNTYYLNISVDGGRNWIQKGSWSYATQSAWTKVQIDLTEYKSAKNFLIMFNFWGGDDYDDSYWYIDDLQVTEGPTAVTPNAPTLTTGDTQHSITLTWATPANTNFVDYEIYRSTSAGVPLSSANLIKTITDVSTNTYIDSNLDTPGQTYYYRIWVKDTNGLYSSASTEVSATTTQYLTTATFPFFDDMESGGNNWSNVYPWAIDTGTDHTGATGHYWSDSPGGASYANNVSYALSIKINLAGAIRPILHWWQRYAYESQRDYGLVEISTDNSNWTAIYSVTGSSPWEEAVVDLTRWASQTIYLRFRTDSDNNGVNYDGWEVDDVSIKEAPNVSSAWTGNTPYPFTDSFDSEASFTSNWISTNKGKEFVWNNSDGHTASGTAYLYPPQNIPTAAGHYLVLAKPIDLTSSVNPQLSFWHKYRVYNTYYLNISVDGGRNWIQKGSWSYATQSAWTKVQIDLTEYKSAKNFLIMFNFWGGDDYDDSYWYIDDVRVGENQAVPSYIKIVSGDGQQGQVSTALQNPFVALVTDANSQPKPSAPVTFAVTDASGGGTLSVYDAVSGSDGKVSTLLTLKATPGTNTVTATVTDSSPVQSVTFTATGYAVGQAMRLSKVSGDNQTNTVGLSLPNPFVVKVSDILGNAVPNISVYFTKVSGDPAASFSISTPVSTDNAGLAQNTLILGSQTGQVSVSAASSGLIGSPVLFNAYAVLQGGAFGDTDGDGMPDDWELKYGLNALSASDASGDLDSDTLTNLQEYTLGTDPTKADTDNDGMPDGWEVRYNLNPLDPSDAARDANGDGTTNYQHYLSGTVPIFLKHFTVSNITNESMDFYGAFAINDMSAVPGDEVGALCGNAVCGQFTVTTPGQYGFMHVYKPDGMAQGSPITFKAWKASSGIEMTTTATVISGTNPPAWMGDKQVANVNLNGVEKQTIPLKAGWNLVSFSVKNCYYTTANHPLEPMLPGAAYIKISSIADVLSSIDGKYEIVRGFDSGGARTFDPSLPAYSDMTYMAAGYAYWIKMTQAADLVLSGTRAAPSDTLALHSGWNLTGYWGEDIKYVDTQPTVAFPADATQYTLLSDLGSVFTSISGKYSIIRSFDTGFHTYDPFLPGFNDMLYIGPGYGMWIKMNTPSTLYYE